MEFAKVITETDLPAIVVFAKAKIVGHETALEKHHHIAAIEKRAAQIYGDDISSARAFAHLWKTMMSRSFSTRHRSVRLAAK